MSSKNSNKLNIPEAKAAMNKFKMEAASDLGVYPPQRNDDIQQPETLIYIEKRLYLQAFPPFLLLLKHALAQYAKNDIIISET